ncbi:hypothetical protein DUI87_17977 [Hirundo rustica rustica]|uniref:Uncharacterized protein n=1 Tax=Hirundo rustica rustica TaxID=333673 RepID=A0A3M0JVP2_HIRRU|nr:hypothetical protein DUI87_17977 [Hirundo rustica rustica]
MTIHPCEAHAHEQSPVDAHQLSEPQAVLEEEVMLQGQSLGSELDRFGKERRGEERRGEERRGEEREERRGEERRGEERRGEERGEEGEERRGEERRGEERRGEERRGEERRGEERRGEERRGEERREKNLLLQYFRTEGLNAKRETCIFQAGNKNSVLFPNNINSQNHY